MAEKLDDFTTAYIEAALWSSTGDDDEPLDKDHSITDIAPETVTRMVADCAAFQAAHGELLTSENCHRADPDKQGGHDFWLTRNGHGAGFWDGDWLEPAATTLTDASKAFGECNLYVGDDGKIYC